MAMKMHFGFTTTNPDVGKRACPNMETSCGWKRWGGAQKNLRSAPRDAQFLFEVFLLSHPKKGTTSACQASAVHAVSELLNASLRQLGEGLGAAGGCRLLRSCSFVGFALAFTYFWAG